MGGVSLESVISGNIDEVIGKYAIIILINYMNKFRYYAIYIIIIELSYREIIVALSTLMVITVIFGLICVQHRKKKKKQINMEYMHFEVSLIIDKLCRVYFKV